MSGSAMVWSDDLENGLILLERAMTLGPLDPSFFMNLVMVAGAELCLGRPERAIELAQRSAALNPSWDSAYWLLAAAFARLDRLEEARAALARFLALWPDATVTTLRQRLPFRNGPSFDMVLDGLRKAGLPE